MGSEFYKSSEQDVVHFVEPNDDLGFHSFKHAAVLHSSLLLANIHQSRLLYSPSTKAKSDCILELLIFQNHVKELTKAVLVLQLRSSMFEIAVTDGDWLSRINNVLHCYLSSLTFSSHHGRPGNDLTQAD